MEETKQDINLHPTNPNILVITDVGHDYDDSMAIIELLYLHKEGKINLVGVISTLKPELERAKIALYTIQAMGVSGIVVAKGTEGSDDDTHQKLEEYEMIEGAEDVDSKKIKEYFNVVPQIFEKAKDAGRTIRLLSIGGHCDVWKIIEENKDDFVSVVSEVHIQGGCTLEKGKVACDIKAANNTFDKAASLEMYTFLAERTTIKTRVYRNLATFESTFSQDVFKVESSMPDLANYLQRAHIGVIKKFFFSSRNPPDRYKDKDRKWFISTRLHKKTPEWLRELLLSDPASTETDKNGKKLGTNDWERWKDDVLKYSVVASNDGLAALGCADIVDDDILNPEQLGEWTHFMQIGEQINGDKMSRILQETLTKALQS